MLNWLIPDFHSERARSADSIPPWVMSVMYLRLIALFTAETMSSRSRRNVGSPPVKVDEHGIEEARGISEAGELGRFGGRIGFPIVGRSRSVRCSAS